MAAPLAACRERFLGGGNVIIHEPKGDPDRQKEVKVKIPVGFHVKLHSMKVLTGKQISDAVTEALEVYFATHPLGHPANPVDSVDFDVEHS